MAKTEEGKKAEEGKKIDINGDMLDAVGYDRTIKITSCIWIAIYHENTLVDVVKKSNVKDESFTIPAYHLCEVIGGKEVQIS